MSDPQDMIAGQPMRRLQIWIVALCVVLNALDGFDVLSVSFASPGIAKGWGIDRAALGLVLSMELIGMAVGSVTLGACCDRWGRRPVALLCLCIMASGMALAATASGLGELSIYRLYTGFGIGGMLAATNAIAAEFSNARRKYLAVTLMAGGYPLGAVLGGTLVSHLLVTHAWPIVFVVGGVISALLIPVTFFLLPESIAFLAERRPPDALLRINHVLARLGCMPVTNLVAREADDPRASVKSLFAPAMVRTTLLITSVYFLHMMTFYFILKWTPKIVSDLGFAASSAGVVLVWANVGGLLGSVAFALVSQRLDVRTLAIGGTLCSFAAVALFGQSPPTLNALSLFAVIASFFTNGTVVCLYAILATRLPTAVRAAGTGFAIGVGRGGAAASPIIVGLLFANGFAIGSTALVIGLGSLGACIALVLLRPLSSPPELSHAC